MNWRNLIDTIQDGVKISIRAEIVISPDKPKGRFKATCDKCEWSDSYSSPYSAKRGLHNHQKECTGRTPDHTVDPDDYVWIQDIHNGNEQ